MKLFSIILIIINFCHASLLKPLDGSTLNQIHILFEWEQVPNNSFYVLDLSDNPNDIDGDCIICDQYVSESLIYIEKNLINISLKKTGGFKLFIARSFSLPDLIFDFTSNILIRWSEK